MKSVTYPLFWPLIAALGAGLAAAGALAAAYIAEYAYGVFPCTLCLWQRGPLWAAIVIVIALFAAGHRYARPFLLILLLLFVTEAGIAGFHVGVERHWWAGTSSCTVAEGNEANDAASLRARLLGTPVTRCDEITWTFLGQSLALWNVPFSLLLALWMGLALRHGREDR